MRTTVRIFLVTLLPAFAGCRTTSATKPVAPHGQVYYLDGAGGGGALLSWGRGVRAGLRRSGFDGSFTPFRWQTGLGPAMDQGSSVSYKRRKARALAEQIVAYRDAHPGQPVTLIGLSAGTAVAVFALEALPAGVAVERVILLGSSLSSHYDLSAALPHVRNTMYVFTSKKDAVLKVLVPVAGTADRKYCGLCSVGLEGFHLPAGADAAVRRLYAKVKNVAWRPEFEETGNRGGHTGAVHPRFVRSHLAPLLLADAGIGRGKDESRKMEFENRNTEFEK